MARVALANWDAAKEEARLKSAKVASLSERVIGPLTVSDQNQRKVSGPPPDLVNAADLPASTKDGVVRSVLVDPGTEAGRTEFERHHRTLVALCPLGILLRISVPWCRHMKRGPS
jgi:hypothetical protein